MSNSAPSTDRWVVSTRIHGEVLTAEACVSGLEIRLLGLPEGFSQAEAEGWIGSLAASAIEGSAAAIPDDPLPPPLRQSLGGLLFSHAELWQSKQPLCSVALMRESGRVAFGWIGEASVEIYVAGECIVPEWISVRDHLGGEARAWSGDVRHDTRVELVLGSGAVAEPLCRLLAHWPGERAPAIDEARIEQTSAGDDEPAMPARLLGMLEIPQPTQTESASFPPVEESRERIEESRDAVEESHEVAEESREVVEESNEAVEESSEVAEEISTRTDEDLLPQSSDEAPARPSEGVARWLARALGRDRTGESAPSPIPETQDVAAAAEILLPAIEEAVANEPIRSESEPLAPDVPEVIPPTPESPALTARAVRESFPIEDPRAIRLESSRPGAEAPPTLEGVPPIGTPVEKAQWAATLESLGAREPHGLSPAIRDRIRRARGSSDAGEWEPLRIETLASPTGWTGAEVAEIPEPEPVAEAAAEPSPAASPKRGIPRRPDWPATPAAERPVAWGRWAIWTAFVLLLFAGGWIMGSFQNGDSVDRRPSGFTLFLRQMGLGGARFDARIASYPGGAHIAVDGKDTGLRTPSVLSLTPGTHRVELSLPNLGSAGYQIEGKKGDEVPLEAPLWGSVIVAASDPTIPVAVAVDGTPRGFVPVTIDSLSPGPHELRFTGPGMSSWGSAIEIRIGEQKEVLAYPLQSPATGLLQVRATMNEEGDRQPLNGARVWVDGRMRGTTPLTLELPRGPHSVRVTRDKEEAPIQLIDLPGGNQRFASFDFGLTSEFPQISLRVPALFPVDEPVLVSATVSQASARDIREMWLHVRSADGGWRRYAMTVLEAQTGGAVGAAPFPSAVLSAKGATQYYVSALTTQGDEIFTELQNAEAAKAGSRR